MSRIFKRRKFAKKQLAGWWGPQNPADWARPYY